MIETIIFIEYWYMYIETEIDEGRESLIIVVSRLFQNIDYFTSPCILIHKSAIFSRRLQESASTSIEMHRYIIYFGFS